MKDSLKFKESLIMNGKKLTINNKSSGRIIGEVLVEEFDKYGNNIFSETTYNDVTLPGSIFVLEQMFKKSATTSYRFLHNNTVPTGTFNDQSVKTAEWNKKSSNEITDEYISDEYIFGFMVGHGGESATGVISPKYESTILADSNNVSSFLPFRCINTKDQTKITLDPVDDGINYYIKHSDNDINYFYAKGFTHEPKIYTKWSDGSGDVDKSQIDYNVPIITYAEVVLDIDETDIREFFSVANSDQCYINQLGLVAGKPYWKQDPKGTYKLDDEGKYVPADDTVSEDDRYRLDFDDIKLVTTLNFKSKDLSNDENKIKFTYKVYCL